ncbi:hypothetical protein PO909_003765 [Leuciscus waleckii]
MPHLPHSSEYVYRGPTPTIPKFSRPDPSEFARLRIALENLLPPDGTELFKYQILVDHLKLDEAKLIADAFLNSPTPFTDTMVALHEKFGQPHQLALRKIASVLEAPDVKHGDAVAFQKFALQVQSLVGLLKTLGPEGDIELNCGSHVARLLSRLPSEQRGAQDRQTSRPVQSKRTVAILHGVGGAQNVTSQKGMTQLTKAVEVKRFCPFCDSTEHYLSQCKPFAKLTTDQAKDWIRGNNRCWRCARTHHAAQCDLKKPCNLCQGKHLRPLHNVNVRSSQEDTVSAEKSCLTSSSPDRFYLDKPVVGTRVMLKVVPVHIHYEDRTLDTFALLDDGSERTILLPTAAKGLGIQGTPEDLPLHTVRQDIEVLHGSSISFQVSPSHKPQTSYKIEYAFTADRLNLSQQSYPVDQLQRKYKHLRGLPILPVKDAQPLLLIGSDQPHLITPIEPIRLGSPGGPAAVHTRLGWTLQGPASIMGRPKSSQQCLLTSILPTQDELFKNVQRLWQIEAVPHRDEKEVTLSKQDQEALKLLETKTIHTEVNGILRLGTPLLRQKSMPRLHAPKESVMPNLRSIEKRLLKDPVKAKTYSAEMEKLIQTGAVQEVTEECDECWYIPHHLVSHNGKSRVVFNCSHQYQGQSLNQYLVPGPTLGASLLGVLIRFREHPAAVSGDIKAMFHQSLSTPEAARYLVDRLREMLSKAGFEIRQWASNVPSVLNHLPPEARAESLELWLAQDKADIPESTLGLSWNWQTDTLAYKHRPVVYSSTVLTWLNSESCHYKVFVGNRVAEIQELTEKCSWRYVDSASNPADDLTRGKPLNVLTEMNRWSQGPPFLLQDPVTWPELPRIDLKDDHTELRKSVFCGATAVPPQSVIPDVWNHNTWQELMDATVKETRVNPTPESFPDAEAVHLDLLSTMNADSFLMALRRFVARRGTPAELWSDQGTNFKGGERELREAFAEMAPDLQKQLARQKIQFHFNPPAAPHVLSDNFWTRFIRNYLPGLQTRQKWQSSPPDLTEKMVVMVVDPQMPRALWPAGHVIKTHRSPDGHVRSADVEIKGQVYTRPVARMVILPALPDDGNSSANSP